MLGGMNYSLSQYALSLRRKDLQILVRPLTGHAELNRHLTLIKVKSDALCPLYQEEDETSRHLLGRCSATMICRYHILGSHVMDYSDPSKLHWSSLLKFAKASKRLF